MEEVRSMEEHSDKGTLFFYGLPAYGHTLSNLYLAGRLAGAGFRVVYYSAEPFRENIEENNMAKKPDAPAVIPSLCSSLPYFRNPAGEPAESAGAPPPPRTRGNGQAFGWSIILRSHFGRI